MSYHSRVTSPIDDVLEGIERDPTDVTYDDALAVCRHLFGEPAISTASQAVFRTPWPRDPRLSVQNVKGRVKPHQVSVILRAARRFGDG